MNNGKTFMKILYTLIWLNLIEIWIWRTYFLQSFHRCLHSRMSEIKHSEIFPTSKIMEISISIFIFYSKWSDFVDTFPFDFLYYKYFCFIFCSLKMLALLCSSRYCILHIIQLLADLPALLLVRQATHAWSKGREWTPGHIIYQKTNIEV